MKTFADVSDLQARWRTLSDEESAVAEQLLQDASAMVASQVDVTGRDTYFSELLKIAVCAMVRRAMSASAMDLFGATQQSITAGPYTQQATYDGPSGELYLTKGEKRMLGIGGGEIGTIPPRIGPRRCRHD